MSAKRLLVFLCLASIVACWQSNAIAARKGNGSIQIRWHEDYRAARELAQKKKQMLLLHFITDRADPARLAVDAMIAADEQLRRQVNSCVLVRLNIDTTISIDGEPVKLLSHAAFQEMHGHGGFAMIDLMSEGKDYYDHVVSAFPNMVGKYYRFRADNLPVILGLPTGTLTQRTMVWAVRTHPESPRSTAHSKSQVLVDAAASHSLYQAEIGVQGHHQWESRFHALHAELADGRTPVEVVAESWPGQTMIDSCIDCVASWRQSSGHWNAVYREHPIYGYDIHQGSNGIWYGTGIFAD